MQLHDLKRIHPRKKSAQVGRGGKRGKTSGRGGKGQTARAGNKRRPELRDLIKKLPKMRGRGKNSNKTIQHEPIVPVNLYILEDNFATGTTITPALLVEKDLIDLYKGNNPIVKILSDGDLTKKFVIENCRVSKMAKEKIEKAGGSIVPLVKIA